MRRTARTSSSVEPPAAASGEHLRLGDAAPREPLGWAAMEVVWLLAIFFLFAGSPPPDVGEAHYLAKAKHYWDPSWAAGDLFLESGDAHWVFYWTFGWVTKYASLEATAWIGRFISWLLLAWSWRRLSWAVVPVRLAALLSAGMMLLLARRFHLAGEWIVGGVEAKSFAYGFVFLALESLIRGRWRAATLLAGAATAFHVLVGGWTLVGLAVVWLASPKTRLPLRQLWPALLGGAVLTLPGVVPALLLTRGVDDATVSAANVIYVFERLPHHLVVHRFEHLYMARSAVLLAVWGLLAWRTWKTEELRRLNLFVATALGLAVIGVAIDQSLLWNRELAAKLLKYYWFRLADAMLPVSVALQFTRLVVVRYQQDRLGAWLLTAAILAAGWNLGDACLRRSRERLPGSFLQPKPVVYRETFSGLRPAMPADRLFEYWVDANEWIRQNTPEDARFLTPRRQQTFKWYAHRPEVANWKDVPQDAATLVEWRQAIHEIYPPGRGRFDLAAHSEAELLQLAEKYDADYVLLDRLRSVRPLSWRRVYPAFDEQNPAYEVYRVPRSRPSSDSTKSPAG
jgi:hypothetical protein